MEILWRIVTVVTVHIPMSVSWVLPEKVRLGKKVGGDQKWSAAFSGFEIKNS